MCEEKHVSTKVCACCGNELPITAFNKHGRSKDGYSSVCRACKAKIGDGNPELAKFTKASTKKKKVRIWDTMSIDQRLKGHFDLIASDFHAESYTYKILDE